MFSGVYSSLLSAGDTIALETFIEFSAGSDVVLHESVSALLSVQICTPAWLPLIIERTMLIA